MNGSNIINIKVYDNTYTLLFKGEAKLQNKGDFEKLNYDLMHKTNLQIVVRSPKSKSGWFD